MHVIKEGSRGPAVEDIQRRLTALGYTLGKTGVDGVFLEDTVASLTAFQRDHGLEPTGEVDAETWSVLVDSSFAFGDRMLYLRSPFFHGADIEMLQVALNSLGFTAGAVDGIFSTYTERAVIEFQDNMNLASDGVVGPETFAALNGLRHLWEGKDVMLHSLAEPSPTQRSTVLADLELVLHCHDDKSYQVARRVRNLAQASYEDACITITYEGETSAIGSAPAARAHHAVCDLFYASSSALGGPRTVALTRDDAGFAAAVAACVTDEPDGGFVVTIAEDMLRSGSKQGFQNTAVSLLDAVCGAYGHPIVHV